MIDETTETTIKRWSWYLEKDLYLTIEDYFNEYKYDKYEQLLNILMTIDIEIKEQEYAFDYLYDELDCFRTSPLREIGAEIMRNVDRLNKLLDFMKKNFIKTSLKEKDIKANIETPKINDNISFLDCGILINNKLYWTQTTIQFAIILHKVKKNYFYNMSFDKIVDIINNENYFIIKGEWTTVRQYMKELSVQEKSKDNVTIRYFKPKKFNEETELKIKQIIELILEKK